MIVYKVVIPFDKKGRTQRYASAVRRIRTHTCSMASGRIYQIGKTTKPFKDAGPLCAFADCDQAKRLGYAWCGQDAVVLECKAVRSRRDAIWVRGSEDSPILTFNLPHGTILCSSVTPIRVVSRGWQ